MGGEKMLFRTEDKVFPGVSQKGNGVPNATAHRAWFTKSRDRGNQ